MNSIRSWYTRKHSNSTLIRKKFSAKINVFTVRTIKRLSDS